MLLIEPCFLDSVIISMCQTRCLYITSYRISTILQILHVLLSHRRLGLVYLPLSILSLLELSRGLIIIEVQGCLRFNLKAFGRVSSNLKIEEYIFNLLSFCTF